MVVRHSRPSVDRSDVRAVSEILASGNIAQGEKVREFEDEFARFVGVKYAVACSSGTAALDLALLGLGVCSGDEVVMPSYVCPSPYVAALHVGATPKVADIDVGDLNICAETVEPHLSRRTKAVIVPHMFGMPADLDGLLGLGVPVIEDCAQSLGAEYKGRRLGSVGELSVSSFYATKMITTGEDGMVLTDSDEFFSRASDARDCNNKSPGGVRYNYKMTDFQAALGLSQLKRLRLFIERRRWIASVYAGKFSECGVTLPRVYSDRKSVFYRYVVMVDELECVEKSAKKSGVMCEKPVWKPLHKGLARVKCLNSDYVFDHALSVPLYPSLTGEEVRYVTETLGAIIGGVDKPMACELRWSRRGRQSTSD